ncbi:hypothetical protein FVE67_00830 [Thermosulfurimonas marina]|uniref:Uncharacterized protein n=1 Tax=Thermosulfurimonas marina TaxID=2047767 RepID=A0A6H1WQI1_9BACT|nr:hypothetical protein [Thermosulfurimonas marina]QJA05418.1 hypothetical protein FVE67_00830 [Thermosulfurimonas marina]
MKDLWRIYLREWLGLLFLGLLLVSSTYLAARYYYAYRYHQKQVRALKTFLQESLRVEKRLEPYAHYSFWRTLGVPQEVYVLEKVGLEPLRESLKKLSRLYVEKGLFFLEEFRLETCVEKRPGQEGTCVPYLEIKGKKVVF